MHRRTNVNTVAHIATCMSAGVHSTALRHDTWNSNVNTWRCWSPRRRYDAVRSIAAAIGNLSKCRRQELSAGRGFPTHTPNRFTVCSRVASAIADAFVETARAHINKAKISRKQSTKSQVSSGRGMGATNVLRPTHSHSKWLLESAWLWRMLHLQWKCINPGATASTRVHRFAHYLPSNSSNAALCCGSGAIALHESSEIRRSFVVLVARRFALIQN